MHLKGKTVGVIAPAGVPDRDNVARGIALLESWGLEVRVGAHVTDRFRYFAGTHENRRADLAWALTDPSIDIVWIARGGYGCVHCLPAIPATLPRAKTVIGFSDATSLFCAMHGMRDARLIHGPSLGSLAAHVDDASRQSVLTALSGGVAPAIALQRLHGPHHKVSGRLHGGNITTLASVAGTQWQADCTDAIVLLEDITELAYRLDRSITLLKESGTFDGARAFVLGEFVRCPLPENANYTLHDILVDLLAPFDVPIFAGLPVGHAAQNHAWTYGAHAHIEGAQLVFDASHDASLASPLQHAHQQ
ncbi:S66 peptidase family protein [Paraburkholderia rhizosphaerae]|uniref:Murein tetrapeptidase LD-carboxypeptidase n=1 Tax=Paraburkholderia rhizosphaerae TaxID=480658 RepID=A0A4R8L5Z6_9BURK|nr:LD-carboxypeptidase [Paraburkholderia rhizosphaerae]TDY37469.1 murein tetrapeptidase LD-carboxypeptidase [Paraburkholderia rhizosphaerae]